MNNTPTFEKMVELHDRGLVSMKKQEQNGQEFYIFKYKNKVFYDNLWSVDDTLLETRGIVFNSKGEIVQLPLKKVFNLGENGTMLDFNRKVIAAHKVNGFMLAVTKYDDKLLFSTTGSLKSDFVELGRKVLTSECKVSLQSMPGFYEGYTYIFEICHHSDPHIVEEQEGAYLLGIRDKRSGRMVPDRFVKTFASLIGVRFAESEVGSFGRFVDQFKELTTEGYMIYDVETNEPLVKMKTPHYLSKKAIMRLGKGKVEQMFANPTSFKKRIDEEFYSIVDYIVESYTVGEWKEKSDQDRRAIIDDFYNT